MKWITHVLWGIAVLSILHTDLPTAAAAAAAHTVITDVLGHRGLHRNGYHDLISILTAVVISVYLHNPAYLMLGTLHIFLDWASPGKLAVSWAYNAIWSLPAALLIALVY
jgi:hypothetical protein